MKEKTIKRFNISILILFLIILLIFTILYNIYSIGTLNRIKNELENFTNSISLRMENKYIEMMTFYFKEELDNYEKANNFTNLVKENIRLGITPHFNSLKLHIDDAMKVRARNITYALLLIALFMFLSILILNFTNNNLTQVLPDNTNIINKEKTKSTINNNEDDNIKLEIQEMYKDLVEEIKNQRVKEALEIIEKMFKLDDKNYLTLNGAGILYSKMYSRENKKEYFLKANEYYENALSLYDYSDNIANNKAVIYSVKYELEEMEEDYETSLSLFNSALNENSLDVELINNRATLYSVKYQISKDENIFKKALNDYNELINIDFNNIYTLNNRSTIYFNKYKNTGNKIYFNKSIEDRNAAFEINPSKQLYDNIKYLYIYKY